MSQNSQANTFAGISFLIKLNFIKSETLAQVFSGEIWKIFKNTTGRLLLIIAISIAVKEEFVNRIVNYGTKTKE